MALIKEPKGIDFVIKSRELTKEEEAGISEYIRKQKSKRKKKYSLSRKVSIAAEPKTKYGK